MTGSGPARINVFFQRWMSLSPLPLTAADQAGGYWWELSMRQVETSRTIVFDAPRRARAFVEALVRDNLDLGRPDSVELIFTGKRPGGRGRPARLDTVAKTKVVTRDTEVTINAFFKHSRVKQYLKDGGRCGSKRSSTHRTICAATADLRTWTSCRPRPVP